MFRICGPKYSLCCTIVSIWGIIQLTLMGGFFWIHSVSLAEDIGVHELDKYSNYQNFTDDVDVQYEAQAYKCWVAVAIYVASLLFSVCQLHLNSKRSYETTS